MKKVLKQILKDVVHYQPQHYTVTYRDRTRGNITVSAADVVRGKDGLLHIRGALVPIHRILRIVDVRSGTALIDRTNADRPPVERVETVSIETVNRSNIYDVYRFTDEILRELEHRIAGVGWREVTRAMKQLGAFKEMGIQLDRKYRAVTVMSENPLYGTTVVEVGKGKYRVFRGYPHLIYYDQFLLNCRNGFWIEEKLNGTCVRVTPLLGNSVYGTRRNFQVARIPIFNPTFDKALIEQYPRIYAVARLERKMRLPWINATAAMDHVIRTFSYDGVHQLVADGYTVFAELHGYGNPIQIDERGKYGVYDKFLDLRVLDICDTRTHRFLGLPEKRRLCQDHGLPLVSVEFELTGGIPVDQLHAHIERFKVKASDQLREGMVMKTVDRGLIMAKVKPTATKHFAVAMSEGRIPEAAFQHAFTKVARGLDWVQRTSEAEIADQIVAELTADFYQATVEANREDIDAFVRQIKTKDAVRVRIGELLWECARKGIAVDDPKAIMPLISREFPNIKVGALYQSYRQALTHAGK